MRTVVQKLLIGSNLNFATCWSPSGASLHRDLVVGRAAQRDDRARDLQAEVVAELLALGLAQLPVRRGGEHLGAGGGAVRQRERLVGAGHADRGEVVARREG